MRIIERITVSIAVLALIGLSRLEVTAQTAASARVKASASIAPYRKLRHMHHTSWGERDGLPVAGVNSIVRTPDGYLWLGSVDGLFRFDGVRFTRFNGSNVSALSDHETGAIMPLLVDRNGVLWISRADGALVTYHNRTFTEMIASDTSRSRVSRLVEMGDGTLWAHAGRLFVIRNRALIPAPIPAGLRARAFGITADGDGGVWIGTSDGELWHWNRDVLRERKFNSTRGEPLRPIASAADASVWILHHGVSRLSGSEVTDIRAPGAPGLLNGTDAAVMADGSMVVSARGRGLVRWKDGVVDAFSEEEGLSDASVRDVFVDADGSIWAATDAGLDRLRIAPFITLDEHDRARIGSPSAVLATPDGAIWSKSTGQLHMYRLSGGIVGKPPSGAYGDVHVDSILPAPNLSARYVIHTSAGRSGVLLGATEERMFIYDRDRMLQVRSDALERGIVQATNVDSTGAIWIASSPNGVTVIRNGVERLIPSSGMPVLRTSMGLARDARGDLWASTASPAAYLRIRGDSVVERIVVPGGESNSAGRPAIEATDSIWSSMGGSLVRIVNSRAVLVEVPAIETVILNASLVMIAAKEYLWIASGNGILRIRLSELHALADRRTTQQPVVERFNSLDGLLTAKLTNTNRPVGTKAPDGRLWFGTPAGLAVVDPSEMGSVVARPILHIEETTVAGTEIASTANGVEIPAHPERIEIHFTATGLLIPERVRLQYRMDGADNSWVDAKAARVATYTQLRHGEYRFRVRAWHDGELPGEEATMRVVVRPRWYESALFAPLMILLIATLGSTLVYVAFRARTRIVADQMRARYEAEVAERARLARELHDTLLQGFTGITLQLQAIRQTVVHSPQHAQAALDRILTTADVSLREARTMVWDMRAPELDDQSLADAVRSVVASAVGDSGIDPHVEVSGDERKLPLSIETAVLRVAREAIANTVKHACATRADVRIDYGERVVTLTVSDNGTGFDEKSLDAKANGGHWGLKGMQERAARARGELRVRSGAGEGTTVELVLPTSHSG